MENQMVLERPANEIIKAMASTYGVAVTKADIAAYRAKVCRAGTQAMKELIERSRGDIGKLIEAMASDRALKYAIFAEAWVGVEQLMHGE
jgi:hypothetical protein